MIMCLDMFEEEKLCLKKKNNVLTSEVLEEAVRLALARWPTQAMI